MPTLDDIEMASAALLSTVTLSHRGSQLTAIRMLRDECGWTLLRAKIATDHVLNSNREIYEQVEGATR